MGPCGVVLGLPTAYGARLILELSMSGPLILIIDPQPSDLKFAREALTAQGCSVMTAVDGRRGHAAFRDLAPALVITEVLMPEVDGIELITAIRRADESVPILAVSRRVRFGPLELLDLAQHVGATATLPKPFTASGLTSTVVGLLPGVSLPQAV